MQPRSATCPVGRPCPGARRPPASRERERLHLAALAAALGDDYDRVKARLGQLLRLHPRDALALQVAHSFDYVTGDATGMNRRVAAVLPAWSSDLPGYDAVLAMHAFGLEECGEYEHAEDVAREALDLNPLGARAHHVMAHVFEMTERADAGVHWMSEHIASWGTDTIVATHGWWHLRLFHLSQGQPDRDVLNLTLMHAIERIRRPASRMRHVPPPPTEARAYH